MNKRKLKKVLVLFMMISSLLLFSCKKTRTDVEWINDGIEMISDEIDLDDENYIKSIRLLYDGLTEKEKKKIIDYQKLVEAEEKIYDLKLQSGKIIELKYSQNIFRLDLKYISGEEAIEKSISNNEITDFLLKLSKINGEKKNKSGADKSKIVEIHINDDTITCYYNSEYFIFNGSAYVYLEDNLNFVFEYFDK